MNKCATNKHLTVAAFYLLARTLLIIAAHSKPLWITKSTCAKVTILLKKEKQLHTIKLRGLSARK